MKDERNRLGKGFAVAIVAHVIFALLLGVFGLTFNSNRPPEILEVSLVAGGGAPEEPQEEIVEEAEPVVEEEDQIVESKEKPKEEPKKPVAEKKKQKPKANPKKGDNKPVGKGDGKGNGLPNGATLPQLVHFIQPKCPSSAHEILAKGTASIVYEIHITYQGKVVDIKIIDSSGNADFDKVALEAMRKSRFSPARNKFKQKIDCRVTLPIKYKIR